MQAPFADPLSGLEQLNKALPLVGRDIEMQLIRTLLDTVALDRPTGPRALTITGDIGVGKSRLLAEIITQARSRNFRILEARTYEPGKMFPYLPFIEALRPVIRSSPPEQLRRYLGLDTVEQENLTTNNGENPTSEVETISPVGIPLVSILARLFPDLPRKFHVTPIQEDRHKAQSLHVEPDQEKFHLFDAIATFLEHMAFECPILLSIDNLQWADSASLELTMYLTVRLHNSNVALVGVTRPPGTSNQETDDTDRVVSLTAASSAAKALAELMRQGLLLLLPLSPLSEEAASQHLHALLPGTVPENILQALLARSEGNPFFLEELVRMLTLNGQLIIRNNTWRATHVGAGLDESIHAFSPALLELPTSITLAVEQRLQELTPACRELLRIAALFGRTFPLQPLIEVYCRARLIAATADLSARSRQSPIYPTPLNRTSTSCEDHVQALLNEAIQASIIAKAPTINTPFDEPLDDLISTAMAGTSPATTFPAPANEALSSSSIFPLGASIFMFCQGIVQEVLTTEIPSHQGRALHGAIGPALETYYAGSTSAHCTELARHYVLGGEQEKALYWSLLAGEDAARQQAHREAISHFRIVLKLLTAGVQTPQNQPTPSVAHIHIAIGESWFKLGELEQALQSFQQALEQNRNVVAGLAPAIDSRSTQQSLAPGESPSLLLAKANRLLADVYRMQGNYDLALTHLQAARNSLDAETNVGGRFIVHSQSIAPLPVEASPLSWLTPRTFSSRGAIYRAPTGERESTTEHLLLLQAQATFDLLLNRGKEAETAFWQSHQLAAEIGDRSSQAFALHMIGWIRGWGEHIHEAIRLQKQAHELYLAVGDPYRAALGDQGLGIIYQALGEMEQARLHNMRGFERARRYGVRYVLGWLYCNLGLLALAQGDWSNSESHLQQAMQEAETTNNIRLKPVVLQMQAELHFRRGNWQEADQLFQSATSAAANTEWYASTMALYGHFLAVTGRKAAAKAQLDRAAVQTEPIGYAGHFYIPFLAEGYLHVGANERAATYIERIRTLHGFMYYGTSVDRILAEVAALQGDWETAEQAFEEGLALCQRATNQPEEASILYEQARTLLMHSRNEPEPPSQSLQRMHSLCDRARDLFLQYHMQRAASLVDTLQEGVRQLEQQKNTESVHRITYEHIAHPEYQLDLHLTRRELEVLRLVAEGHTDREVAETLVISHRTVNRHLSNIFVKLNVPGRAAAVAYAIRQGLVG